MKCYFCEAEANGICAECARGVCKTHAEISRTHRIGGGRITRLVCNDCATSWTKEP